MINFYEGHKVYMNGNYPAIFLDGKNVHVHRLEWIKHHGEIPEGFVVHHKDENKMNWNIENLELISRGNHISKHRESLLCAMGSRFGDNARNRKLTQEEVNYIRKIYVKYDKEFGGRALAEQFGVTEGCISQIIRGRNWGGGGVC